MGDLKKHFLEKKDRAIKCSSFFAPLEDFVNGPPVGGSESFEGPKPQTFLFFTLQQFAGFLQLFPEEGKVEADLAEDLLAVFEHKGFF
jgi:hypothetical protein